MKNKEVKGILPGFGVVSGAKIAFIPNLRKGVVGPPAPTPLCVDGVVLPTEGSLAAVEAAWAARAAAAAAAAATAERAAAAAAFTAPANVDDGDDDEDDDDNDDGDVDGGDEDAGTLAPAPPTTRTPPMGPDGKELLLLELLLLWLLFVLVGPAATAPPLTITTLPAPAAEKCAGEEFIRFVEVEIPVVVGDEIRDEGDDDRLLDGVEVRFVGRPVTPLSPTPLRAMRGGVRSRRRFSTKNDVEAVVEGGGVASATGGARNTLWW